ncbi:MAG TPA: Rrf2 family transcriptional regulator [Anaeromyxobacteraceae bacterium]|jgi:Rrf2 family protein
MRLQTATRIAIYAVLDLAADPARQLSSAQIAGRFGVSGNHLSKVLRVLGRVGLVEALRGAGGGYRFRGNAKRLTLLDVIRLFEDVGPGGEPGEPAAATAEGHAVRRVLDEIDDTAQATLSSITVATMLKLVEAERRAGAPGRPAGRAAARALARVAG